MTLANLVTLSRLPLLLLVVLLLFIPRWQVQLVNLGLLIILFILDWCDGYLARLRREVTELGAVLDVALDRAVENILWVAFIRLGLAPLWAAIIFLTRSFVVDGIRGVALAKGQSVFGMMHSAVGCFLVASRFMRAFYGFAKGWSFGFLLLTHALVLKDPGWSVPLHSWNQVFILLTCSLCLLRGVPVILDGRIYFGAGKQ